MNNTTPIRSTDKMTTAAIKDLVAKHPKLPLKAGYIGNIRGESDDRMLFIWIEGSTNENGNTDSIWHCSASCLTRKDVSEAAMKIRIFKQGYEAAMKAAYELTAL